MTYELPSAFHFTVAFASQAGTDAPDDAAVAFQEVSGLETDFDVEEVVEGGENRFVHRLPTRVTTSSLTLKRGVVGLQSELVRWTKETLEESLARPVEPRSLIVTLQDGADEPAAAWIVGNAYPIKWSAGALDSMKNEVVIETIELAYTTLRRQT
ncbi:MAG: phage tail protein [Paracoccaceae bacterium]